MYHVSSPLPLEAVSAKVAASDYTSRVWKIATNRVEFDNHLARKILKPYLNYKLLMWAPTPFRQPCRTKAEFISNAGIAITGESVFTLKTTFQRYFCGACFRFWGLRAEAFDRRHPLLAGSNRTDTHAAPGHQFQYQPVSLIVRSANNSMKHIFFKNMPVL